MGHLIAILLCILAVPLAGAAEGKPPSVFFVGNSLTLTNNLPEMIRTLAEAGKQPAMTWKGELVGGATLEDHWGRGKAQEKFKAGHYDYFVIQGSSTETVKEAESFAKHVGLFAELAKAGQAKPLLYMTWGRREQAAAQAGITQAYRDAAKASGATIVPVGLAWEAYRTKHDEAALFKDSVHPSPLGTYLTACVFYAVIYQTSPVGLPGDAAQLDAATAKLLQEIAWSVVDHPKPTSKTRR